MLLLRSFLLFLEKHGFTENKQTKPSGRRDWHRLLASQLPLHGTQVKERKEDVYLTLHTLGF